MNANEVTLLWADEYSRLAEPYDRVVTPRFEPIARFVADAASPRPGEQFLDLGTGTGLLARILAPRVLPQTVVAIDLADNSISVGSYRAGDSALRNIRFEMMDARNIVYRGRLFDGVVSNFGIPSFGADRTFSESFRVLRPEGRFVFSEWDAEPAQGSGLLLRLTAKYGTDRPSKELTLAREAHRLAASSEEVEAMGRPPAVRDALESAGFERVEVLTKAFPARFATVADFLAFEACWGHTERELAEMPADSRAALEEELGRSLMGPDGIDELWQIHVYVARSE